MRISAPVLVTCSLLLACGSAGPEGSQQPAAKDGESAARVEKFDLPGATFFPEGIAAAADGRLFIGSMTSGDIVVRKPGAVQVETFVPAGTHGLLGATGLAVDEARGTLWVCAADVTFQTQWGLRSFDVNTGSPRARADLPKGAICNDLTVDRAGNVYVTDSFGFRIYRLPEGSTTLDVWSEAEEFKSSAANALTVNGIAWTAESPSGAAIYTVRTDTGALFRVPIDANGAAGKPVKIAIDGLKGPDGVEVLGPKQLLVVESDANRVSLLALEGDTATSTVLNDGLDQPTTAAVTGDIAWVVEGQILRLFDPAKPQPNLPFMVKRVDLR